MSFFARFFKKNSPSPEQMTQNPLVSSQPELDTYIGAGCTFLNKTHVLCGYQPHKRKSGITGIGGKREPGESILDTAFRETIEELFNLTVVPPDLLTKLKAKLIPQRISSSPTDSPTPYAHVIFHLDQLPLFLHICRKGKLRSELYDAFPLTLNDLIFKRKIGPRVEVESLCLLPIVKRTIPGDKLVRNDFLYDMRFVF